MERWDSKSDRQSKNKYYHSYICHKEHVGNLTLVTIELHNVLLSFPYASPEYVYFIRYVLTSLKNEIPLDNGLM